jgi:hypothetical protein
MACPFLRWFTRESMPSGEVKLADPDGYTVLVVHRGRTEQQAWEKRIGPRA